MTSDQLYYFISLFRSRSDVYARYWQKGSHSGYSPAYQFDWQAFNQHRAQGGRLHDFTHKQTLPLTVGTFLQHLRGEIAIGIYPILRDNTCCFLAADFDGTQWQRDCTQYMQACQEAGLSAHLERSKSGKGGHVWIFFADPYPCDKARRIGLALIRRSMTFQTLRPYDSFDRLFPNQDLLPSGGYGNLIALPLQGKAVAKGNTVFLQPKTLQAYAEQWEYIASIHKHTTAELEAALMALDGSIARPSLHFRSASSARLTITVTNVLTIARRDISAMTLAFLREKLSFLNGAYLTKKRLGKPVYDVQKYFQLFEEANEQLIIPRGFLAQLTDFLTKHQLPFRIVRKHASVPNCRLVSQIQLSTEQEELVEAVLRRHEGILVAPPGSGKTMMALELAVRRQKPTLILVHRRELLEQWIERIHISLALPKTQIGSLSGRSKKVRAPITVGLLQSVGRYPYQHELATTFGTVIVDECHHIPAKTFRHVMQRLNPEYVYGLTATPTRKHNDEQLIYSYVGSVIATMQHSSREHTDFEVTVRKTQLALPFQWKTDQFELLAKVVCFDSARNQRIAEDILEQVRLKRRVLVLSERKEHLHILNLYLKGQCETLLVTGDDSAGVRAAKLRQAQTGTYQILLSTGQLFGEGLDIQTIESLVLAFPFSFEGKLIQYTGRLAHSLQPKALIDYHDEHIAFLDRQFKQRKRYYKKLAQLPN